MQHSLAVTAATAAIAALLGSPCAAASFSGYHVNPIGTAAVLGTAICN